MFKPQHWQGVYSAKLWKPSIVYTRGPMLIWVKHTSLSGTWVNNDHNHYVILFPGKGLVNSAALMKLNYIIFFEKLSRGKHELVLRCKHRTSPMKVKNVNKKSKTILNQLLIWSGWSNGTIDCQLGYCTKLSVLYRKNEVAQRALCHFMEYLFMEWQFMYCHFMDCI